MRRGLLVATLAFAMAVGRGGSATAADFPRPLSPDLPYDVDVAALGRLDRDREVPEAQRLFDIFAWQAFIALNWPAAPDGSPDRTKTLADATSPRVWGSWRTNDSIYLPDGGRPAPWDAAAVLRQPEHFLWRFSKMLNESRQPVNELSASTQAFTGPLVDQNGVFVRYESYVNRTQFDYIVENELYNQEGQVAFAQKGRRIEFPANTTGAQPRHGSMGVKLAWKQLGPTDIPSRFFTREFTVVSTSFDPQGNMVKTRSRQLMGLVGMHVTALTRSSPTWIWATLEHVDNVTSNDLETGASLAGPRVRVRPNFNNPDQPAKLVNILPPRNAEKDAKGEFTSWDEKTTTNPVQLTRVVPIPPATAELNRQVRTLLAEQNSVFRYYELIGAQWPVQPGFPAFGGGDASAPESIYFKIPGRVVPVYVVNTTMESYFQNGNTLAGPLEEDDRLPAGAFAEKPTARLKPDGTIVYPDQKALERVTPDRTMVFGTESCAGCHFSAGAAIAFKQDENGKPLKDAQGRPVPIYGKNASFGDTGNANYVWQLQLKARSKAASPPPSPPPTSR